MTAFLLFGCAFDAALVLALWIAFGDAVRAQPPRAVRARVYLGPERRRTPRPPAALAHAA